ncbi:MAG: lipopolysaccharide heptosyltransferase II [Candidatus Omnitrophica bacterium]|nr:lipopolysaccharide heptosyltransferase II [Candidatus Omnitrophota bacterium]
MSNKRILIVNVNWVGDVIFSTPFIRALRERYPDAYMACLLHPRCSPVLEGNPRINEIIIYDEEGRHRSLAGKLKLIALLRKKRFDEAFILHRSFTKALIVYLAGIKERIGYPTKNRRMLLTKCAEEPEGDTHKVEYFLNLARAAGIEPHDSSYEFFIKDEDGKFIRDLLKTNGIGEGDKIAVICPGGNWDPKRWPKENFALLSDMLMDKTGLKIVISGARKDVKLAENISALMKNKPVITCGKTDLKQLGALMERADLVVANDTGPMHIASAMKAKLIALFGPTSPEITGPHGAGAYVVISKFDECDIPCYDVTCTENRCMAAIKIGDVFEEAVKILGTDDNR